MELVGQLGSGSAVYVDADVGNDAGKWATAQITDFLAQGVAFPNCLLPSYPSGAIIA
jgi:hypothetical protein